MLEQTFTFWRRLIGAAPAVESNVAVEDDRRLWVRYPTDLRGQVQVPEKSAVDRLLANVRDLSLGGASLLVDQPLPAGQMLTLELATDQGEVHSVLACVVRATPQDAGKWSLGCVFSRELTSDDLKLFGAQKVPAGDDDQRVWVRYDCAVNASIRFHGDAADQSRHVQVLNISASGIGLLVPQAIESGRMLTVDLHDKAGRKVCSILACVVHVADRSDGTHSVGCNFIRELTEEELASLI